MTIKLEGVTYLLQCYNRNQIFAVVCQYLITTEHFRTHIRVAYFAGTLKLTCLE